MELFDLSRDVLRQIMISYVDNSKVNQVKIKFIGSNILNNINNDINFCEPELFHKFKCVCESDGILGGHLNLSCAYIYDEIISLLLIDDYECSYIDENGFSLLMYACQTKASNVALKILEFDFNLDQINKDGQTALMIACVNDMNTVALKLLDLNCKYNQIDKHNYSALFCACNHKMSDVACKILDLYSRQTRYDGHEHNILYAACGLEMNDVASKIIDLYSTNNIFPEMQIKATLYFAKLYNMNDVVEWLSIYQHVI